MTSVGSLNGGHLARRRHPGWVGLTLVLWIMASGVAEDTYAAEHEGILAELADCRFLMIGGDETEAHERLDPARLGALYSVLRRTRIGAMVVAQLEKYRTEGIGNLDRPLGIYEVTRVGGPAAGYFESGQMHLSSALLAGLDAEDDETRNQLYTAASFVVHEAVHAISHHLHLTGRFPAYRSDTKVNEALAYFVQGLFLDEVRRQDPNYREDEAVPAWDYCTAHIVRILRELGITPDTTVDDAYDQLAELQLESEEPTALRLAKLWQYFQFIQESGDRQELWQLDDANLPRLAVVENFTDMIAADMQQPGCKLQRTFDYIANRIILYAHYADTPPGVAVCQYFASFVQGLRDEGDLSAILREEIDQWFARRGLTKSPEGER